MGKVWRARHLALKRDDALKVLPDAFASDPERLARFQREAQVLASLNHPNIAHVYGLERTDGYDLARGDFDRFTSDPHNDFDARWSPDGRTLVFSSVRRGQIDLYSGPVDKSSPPEVLYANQYPKWPSSWSPDGKVLAFEERRPETAMDVWLYSMDEKQARSFRHGPFNEQSPQFSPDGRWLAFSSDELGRSEIYVVPYPGPGPTCKVSTSGGDEPRWSQDGKELFYRKGTTAMVVDVANRDFCNPAPVPLFDGLDVSGEAWDVSPRGDLFVTLARREPPRLHLVLNWFSELKRLVPTN